MFKIVQKANPLALYVSGFYTMERAEKWLEQYNPNMWDDKTIQREDLEIVPEEPFKKRGKR